MAHSSTGRVSGAPFRLSWGAILGGMFTAAGIWLLLHALGLALGFSRLEPTSPGALRAASIGGGIWSVVSSTVALFVGGLVTARSAGFLARGNGALHGLVLWGLTALGGTLLLSAVVGSVANDAAMAQGVAAGGTTGSLFSFAGPPDPSRSLGVDTRAMVDAVNERLTQANKPLVSADQLQFVMNDAVYNAMREGRFDREAFGLTLSDGTGLSRAEIREVFGEAEQQLAQRHAALQQRLGEDAKRLAEMTGRMFWGVFALLSLSLIASVLGAMAGVSRRQEELSTQATTPPLSPPLPPISRSGEAFT